MKYLQTLVPRLLAKINVAVIVGCVMCVGVSNADVQLEMDGKELEKISVSYDLILSGGRSTALSLSQVYLYLHDEDGQWVRYSCYEYEQNIDAAGYLPSDRTDPKWIAYATHASQVISKCGPWVNDYPNRALGKLTSVEIHVPDGYSLPNGYVSGIVINNLPVPPPSANVCSAALTSNMSFGIVKGGDSDGPSRAETSLLVECSKSSDLTITVNRGEDLVNPDGVRISLSYQKDHRVTDSEPLKVDIIGTLSQAPSQPGSYTWYVPILVSYE